MLHAIAVHQVDPAREDVYLASVEDQAAVIGDSPDFRGRTVLRSQLEPGIFWLLDRWTDEQSMQMALASARTLSSVAALMEEPRVLLADGDSIAVREEPIGDTPFFMVADTWVKSACVDDYEAAVGRQGRALADRPGFRRRLVLRVRDAEHRYLVADEWTGERAAYEAFQTNEVTEAEAMRFLSLVAERGRPLLATAVWMTGNEAESPEQVEVKS